MLRLPYRFDYEEADHVELLELLKAVPCQVMVSGYRSALYEERLEGWRRVELQVMNHAGVRTECVWMNFVPDRLHCEGEGGGRAIPLSGKGVTGACSAAHFGEHFVSECQAGPRGAAVDPAAGKPAPVAGTRSRQKNGPGGGGG